MIELIWPTQFFNRKHVIGFSIIKFRTYTESILKLKNVSMFYYTFYYYLLRYNYIFKV